jgi:cell division initiation protein
MERIKPSDLENAELSRAIRGYDVVEVHKLLLKAAREISTLNLEIQQLTAENEKLLPLQEQASVVSGAQNASPDKLAEAEHQASQIVASARRTAEDMLAQTKRKVQEIEEQHQAALTELRWDIERTEQEKDRIVATYKSFLTEQLQSIECASRKYKSLCIQRPDNESADPREVKSNFDENALLFDQAVED